MDSPLQLNRRGIHRYPGLRSFEDEEIERRLFYGREREKYDLLHLVLAEQLVVLFARSGMGKSSIINAGLMQPLREKEFFPMVIRLNSGNDNPLDSFYTSVKTACERGIVCKEIDAYEPVNTTDWNRTSLWHFFKTFYIWRGENLLPPVLIIDQFEELFTLISQKPRIDFVSELADLVRGTRPRNSSTSTISAEIELSDRPPDVKVVLSIREDFLANLEEMADQIPEILKSRFRLGPLIAEQARLAVIEPAKLDSLEFATAPFSWSDDTLECILNFLSKRKLSHSEMDVGNEVEPFQLQLICQFVERIVQEKKLETLSLKDLGGENKLQRILDLFYEDSINGIAKKFHRKELKKQLRKLFENEFITAKGRRQLREESTIIDSYRISPQILAEMVQLRLIRKEPHAGENYYELTHDTLIDPILNSRRKWKLWNQFSNFSGKYIFGPICMYFLGSIILAIILMIILSIIPFIQKWLSHEERSEDQNHERVLKTLVKTEKSNPLEEKIQTITLSKSRKLNDDHSGQSDYRYDVWDFDLKDKKWVYISVLSSTSSPSFFIYTSKDKILTPNCQPSSETYDYYVGCGGNPHILFQGGPGKIRILIFKKDGSINTKYKIDVKSNWK